jgi:hypothetical protein
MRFILVNDRTPLRHATLQNLPQSFLPHSDV